jgi:hypothetical protein
MVAPKRGLCSEESVGEGKRVADMKGRKLFLCALAALLTVSLAGVTSPSPMGPAIQSSAWAMGTATVGPAGAAGMGGAADTGGVDIDGADIAAADAAGAAAALAAPFIIRPARSPNLPEVTSVCAVSAL